MAKSDQTTLAILTHVLGIFIGFLGPLIILLVAREKTVKTHAKTALNWQLSLLIYNIISFVLMAVLIGFLLLPILILLNVIFSVVAAVKASNNELWKYPLSIPFLKVN